MYPYAFTYAHRASANDISKGTYQTFSILESFRTAYETLVENIEQRAEELRSWQATPPTGNSPAYHDNWTDNDGKFMPQSMSLLRDVIGFDEVVSGAHNLMPLTVSKHHFLNRPSTIELDSRSFTTAATYIESWASHSFHHR